MAENRRFAIGDIHGCIRTFRHLVEKVLQINAGDTLFLLGDYIDRGPGSKETIEYIWHLGSFTDVRPVMGNHESMLLKSLENEVFFELWLMNGCETTLMSFGAGPALAMDPASVHIIPAKFVEFFRALPLHEQTEDFFFVHAGLDPKSNNPLNDEETILWTRSEEVPEDLLGRRKLIHGHTPVELSLIRQRIADPGSTVINLDGGCVYHFRGLGHLVALDLDQMELYSVKNRD